MAGASVFYLQAITRISQSGWKTRGLCGTGRSRSPPFPYGYVRAEATDGLWRLGDQSVVIPSFAGDGMSIALHSARLAGEQFLSGGNADDYQRCLRRHAAGPVRLATTLIADHGAALGPGDSRRGKPAGAVRLLQATVGGTRLEMAGYRRPGQ